jgi:hypothetical protein
MLVLTPNQGAIVASLSAAIVSAIVSFLTARYIVKHGPDYGKQVSGIHETLAALTKTQEEMRKQQALMFEADQQRHAVAEQRAESLRWKPKAQIVSKVEGSEQVNTLHIQSPQNFSLMEACLCSESGAKLHEYPVLGSKVTSTGFSVPITYKSLLLIANASQSFFQTGRFEGMIRYKAGEYIGEVRFRAGSVIIANTQWFKLDG